MINVLFVCSGNICRSPMAEAVFRDIVETAGLADKFHIDSAGTGSWHVGEAAHSGTLSVLKKHGIVHKGRARQVKRSDFDAFDYILAMDSSNLYSLQRTTAESDAEVAMFLSYANDAGTVNVEDVPDPYYNNRFDEVYDLVTKGSDALLAHIRKQHTL